MNQLAPQSDPARTVLSMGLVLLAIIYLAMIVDRSGLPASLAKFVAIAVATAIGFRFDGSWRGLVAGSGLALGVMEFVGSLLRYYLARI